MLYSIEREVLESDMKSELPKSINKNALIDWVLKRQKGNRAYCHEITVQELVKSAKRCGIKVIRE